MPLAPNTLPARAFQNTRRSSRLLFHWRASDLSLTPVSGEVPTFGRASAGGLVPDSQGYLHDFAQAQPRFEMSDYDAASGLWLSPGLLLEGQRTNIALWSRDLTTAAWNTKTTVTIAKDQTGVDGAANGASSVLATAGNAVVRQAITLASSLRCQSAYVKRLVGSGVVQMTTDGGSTWTAITVTAAWTRVTIPTQTLANPNVGFRLVTNGDKIAVDFVQNENGGFQTSAIATTTVAVTREADALSYAFLAPPQAMTTYADLLFRGTGSNPTVVVIGAIDSNVMRWHVGLNPSDKPFQYLENTSGSSVTLATATAATHGQRVELCGSHSAAGTALAASINQAAAESAAGGAVAYDAAWSALTLSPQNNVPGSVNHCVMRSIKVAAGVRTLAEMRSAF